MTKIKARIGISRDSGNNRHTTHRTKTNKTKEKTNKSEQISNTDLIINQGELACSQMASAMLLIQARCAGHRYVHKIHKYKIIRHHTLYKQLVVQTNWILFYAEIVADFTTWNKERKDK